MFEVIYILNIVFAISFALIALLFTIKKDNYRLIAGFNDLSKDKQDLYNKQKIRIDMRNHFLLYSIIFIVGTILTYLFSLVFGIISIIIWVILFIKSIKLDTDKALKKYKL